MRLIVLTLALALGAPAALAEEPPAEPASSAEAAAEPASGARPAEGEAPKAVTTPAPPPASPAPPASTPAQSAGQPPARARGASQWGLLVDGGLPQGLSLSATFRPVSSVRFFAGPAWNYAGFGIQGGVSVVPWHFAVTPVLTVEAGRYFSEDVSFIASGGQGVPPDIKPLMKNMSYTYGALHAGLEFGSQSAFNFAVDLGLAYVSLAAKGTVTKTDGSGTTVTFKDPRVRATLPSVKLGLHYWF